MTDAASASLPLDGNTNREARTTPRHEEPVRWTTVAEARGLLPARIIANRLQSEGIPARAWQESVGQAYGMVVGPLGTGYVSVPEEFAQQAREILAHSEADATIEGDDEEEEDA